MKLCAIQPPYPYTIAEADSSVTYLIDSLNQCDTSCDIILLPEYSNAPTSFGEGECIPYAKAHTESLLAAVVAAAQRCQAIVAINFAAEFAGKFRNCTRVFNSKGEVAGEYYKQHLPHNETAKNKMDNSYTFEYTPPPIVEVDGICLGFLVCYDAYFEEYIAHLAKRQPDLILVSSHQRGERADILRTLNASLAFHTNAYVLRASVSMGSDSLCGGGSMVVSAGGEILADFGQNVGILECEVADIKAKYMRSNCFGGALISNNRFIEQGRTPWNYRAAGSMVKPNDAQMPYPRVCAHRGFNTIAPENSMPAFGAAIALGSEEIELDVYETLDGEIVVCHDDRIDRIATGTGSIIEMTLEQLYQYDFGIKYAASFAGLRIPRLEEVLKAFSRQVIINLHVKTTPNFQIETMRKIALLVEKYDFEEHVYIMAGEELQEMADRVAPKLARCMGAGSEPLKIVDKAIQYRCQKVQFFKPHYNADLIEKAHAHGIICNMFWSDDPEETKQMLALGIDTILTNDYWKIAQSVQQSITHKK